MVHISPRTIEGRPSAISVELMLTNLICLKKKKTCGSNILENYNPLNYGIMSTLLDINKLGHTCTVVG